MGLMVLYDLVQMHIYHSQPSMYKYYPVNLKLIVILSQIYHAGYKNNHLVL